MNNINNKFIPFIFGAVAGYVIVKMLLSGSVLGYENLNRTINSKRTYPLISSPQLDQIAYCRAKYLFDNNLWTHNGNEKCFYKYGIKWNYGEVLAQGYYDDGVIVQAWLNSPSHRNVMLGNYRYFGSSKMGNITVVTFLR